MVKISDSVHEEIFSKYHKLGFTTVKTYNPVETVIIEKFAINWIYKLLYQWINKEEFIYPLESYHNWSKSLNVPHEDVFKAPNRHIVPSHEIRKILINKSLIHFLDQIGIKRFEIWDEGLGWLAFRFIRPGMKDGYPFSKKAWGPAKNVLSVWIPIIGHNTGETLTLLPGSHLKEYEKYLPLNNKFRKDEYRLVNQPSDSECYSPCLNHGEIIIYHPNVLHTEDVISSDITRLNLEFRLLPVS